MRFRPFPALCSAGYRFHQSSRCGKETTTFGADGNGTASIFRVMKTGSIRAKSDLLREPELRKWSPHTVDGFNQIGVSARLILPPHRGGIIRSDDLASREDVLGKPFPTGRFMRPRSAETERCKALQPGMPSSPALARRSVLSQECSEDRWMAGSSLAMSPYALWPPVTPRLTTRATNERPTAQLFR